MSDLDFHLQAIRDPRLAVHAASGLPAWLWSIDGARILWANPVAAKLFGARNGKILAAKPVSPADPHRRQVMRLAGRLSPLGATRLERLSGFGATLGGLVTCACARLTFSSGETGVLVAATEPVGRAMQLSDRLIHLAEAFETPVAAFTLDGAFAGASDSAKSLPDFFNVTSSLITDNVRREIVADGRADMRTDLGRIALHRIGHGADTAIVALISPVNVVAAHVPQPVVAAPSAPVTPPPVAMPVAHPEPVITPVAPAILTQPPEQSAIAPDQPIIAQDVAPAAVFGSPFDEPAPAPGPAFRSETSGSGTWPSEIAQTVAEDARAVAEPEAPIEETSPDAPQVEPVVTAAVESAPAEAIAHDASSPATEQPHHVAAALAVLDDAPLSPRRHPLRFMWQMDEEQRFSFGSDEFTRLIGQRTAAAFGRLWSEITDVLQIDPEGRVARAVATRDTWSGIVINWPVDGSGARLPVELSGLPVYDRERQFKGYRGFGVCRDLEGLARLAAQRREDILFGTQQSTGPAPGPTPTHETPTERHATVGPDPSFPVAETTSLRTEPDPVVDTPINVVPFRPAGEPKSPSLTAVENNAFAEIARQLSARLEGENENSPAHIADSVADEADAPPEDIRAEDGDDTGTAAWLRPPDVPARAHAAQDVQLLDKLPDGILIYQLDKLIYANPAFLARTGYSTIHALADAGGLDALYVEPGSAATSPDGSTPVVISGSNNSSASDAHLHTITWDGESAMALIFAPPRAEAAATSVAAPAPASVISADHAPADHTQAEELSTILDITAEGILIFDGLGRINSCNRSAEALFGLSASDIAQRNLIDLFAPESQRGILDYLQGIKDAGVASLLDHGRDVLAHARDGGTLPLSMTMGRTRPDSARYFAIFRDKTPARPSDSELLNARRSADRSANAKAEVLARISHEVRTPLNAIIGFAEVMIEERFGALGNERYVDYMKDIRASGERVIAIIDDLLNLSRIESGKLDLSFANQDLNSLVEQCVAAMQSHANRERIIIRTSLAHALPNVSADARALRQIALNLIGTSIHLANAGGQVIVSTATTDLGDVVLRVRDTGHGLNDNEIAAAMAPFRTPAPADLTADSSGSNLSLTKALVEANRAQFHIKSAPNSGTLIEIVFSQAAVHAN